MAVSIKTHSGRYAGHEEAYPYAMLPQPGALEGTTTDYNNLSVTIQIQTVHVQERYIGPSWWRSKTLVLSSEINTESIAVDSPSALDFDSSNQIYLLMASATVRKIYTTGRVEEPYISLSPSITGQGKIRNITYVGGLHVFTVNGEIDGGEFIGLGAWYQGRLSFSASSYSKDSDWEVYGEFTVSNSTTINSKFTHITGYTRCCRIENSEFKSRIYLTAVTAINSKLPGTIYAKNCKFINFTWSPGSRQIHLENTTIIDSSIAGNVGVTNGGVAKIVDTNITGHLGVGGAVLDMNKVECSDFNLNVLSYSGEQAIISDVTLGKIQTVVVLNLRLQGLDMAGVFIDAQYISLGRLVIANCTTGYSTIRLKKAVHFENMDITLENVEALGYTATESGSTLTITESGEFPALPESLTIPLGIPTLKLQDDWVETEDGDKIRDILEGDSDQYSKLFHSVHQNTATKVIKLPYDDLRHGGVEEVKKPDPDGGGC